MEMFDLDVQVSNVTQVVDYRPTGDNTSCAFVCDAV